MVGSAASGCGYPRGTNLRRLCLRVLVLTFAGPGLLVGFLLSGSPGGASAASSLSFSVNTTADAHNAQPGNGQCADSTGQCTLRAAIEASDAAAPGSVTTITRPGRDVYPEPRNARGHS